MGEDDETKLMRLYKERLRDVAQQNRSRNWAKRRARRLSEPQSTSNLLTQLFKGDGQALRKIEETKALLAWEEIVGHAIAKASEALRIRGTQLVVKAPDPLWMQNLARMKNDILRKYREQFPSLKLTDIFFVSR